MPLSQIALNNSLTWTLDKPVTGFADVKQGSDTITATLRGISTDTWDQLFAQQYVLTASGGNATFDLSGFFNLVGEAVNLGHVLTIFVTVSGTNANVALGPSVSNGLSWFLGGTSPTINIQAGGSFSFSMGVDSAGQSVDGTHKAMTLTNNGSGTATVKVSIVGSTS